MSTYHAELLAEAARLRTLLVRDRWNDASTRQLCAEVRKATKMYAEAAGLTLLEASNRVQVVSDAQR
jgi:hypothetical protein